METEITRIIRKDGIIMGAFAIIGIIYIIYKLIQEAYEASRPYDHDALNNTRAYTSNVLPP